MIVIKTKFRQIKTEIPVPQSRGLFEDMKKYEVPDMYEHELPIIWNTANDFQVSDKWGNTWIDFSSGIFVANVGHGAKEVKKAIEKKLKAPLLHSYIFPNDSRIQLTKKICQASGMDKVLLTVTGSEANEAAIQTMRRNRKGKILTLKGANYGSTTGCREILKDAIDESTSPDKFNPDNIAGVFLEVFRGKDAKFVPYDWVQTWYTWAKKNNIPVGFDEMQSGFARTGKMFGHQHYNVQPDFITVGKAFGGGLPISALIGKSKFMQHADDLWSTHTANPISCAAAVAVLDTIKKKKLVEKSAQRSKWVGDLLQKAAPNYKIHGRGMIWGVYTGDVKTTQKIIEKCAERGLLLVSTHGPAIKIGPPLTIPDAALREGIQVIRESVEEIEKNK